MDEAEVAIVGGGPAGAALAIRLAAAGVEVALFERQPEPRWRACGVYSSPLTRGALAALGVGGEAAAALLRPIDAMEVVSMRGPLVRLDHHDPYACGVDRVRLERVLLDIAVAHGLQVHEGAAVRDLRPARGHTDFSIAAQGGISPWRARIVVGADGPASLVARTFGVARPSRRGRHAGITVHRVDPDARPGSLPATARMFLGRGWYCGLAPATDGRVNVGIVMGEATLRQRLAYGGPAAVVDGILGDLPGPAGKLRDALSTDEVRVALPLAHRVARPSGAGYLLVGDAAGFLDPLSGEGLHRAFVSAELAAAALIEDRRGDPEAIGRYARRMHRRFATKDVLSWLLQGFVAVPELADYALRRMSTRDAIRDTFGRVLADQLPASRALGPGFLAGLLRP